jgi:hypothetical protein
MKKIEILKDFVLVFVVTFIVSSAVTFFYSLIIHSERTFDWPTAFRFSITLGIIFPWLHYKEKKNKLGK